MRALAGSRIILAGEHVDHPMRAGEVVGCGPDGAPPYTVRWDDGHTTTMYPGPGAVLSIAEAVPPSEPEPPPVAGLLREWTVRVTLFERGDDTTATVALVADGPHALTARGTSHRGRGDESDPHIGDELAVARALRHLADDLVAATERDIASRTGEHDVVVRAR